VRSLSPDEAALWARVASTIRPLSRDRIMTPASKPVPAPDRPAPQQVSRPRPSSNGRAPVAPAHARAPGTTLDGSWDRRLSSGSVQPDRIVDLHGKSLDGAWRAIDRALDDAVREGERVLLLITGHQRSGEPPVRRGAIRAAVHDWLAASRHARDIAAVRAAHQRHGGGGSLYIILRRRDRR
jgi:DNA-nicking Smr family endonuclease